MTDLYEYFFLKVKFSMSSVDLTLNELASFTEAIYMEPFPNQFNWTFEGTQITVSNDENPSRISFDQLGEYYVSLEIADEFGFRNQEFSRIRLRY
jgi:hypothetical protein